MFRILEDTVEYALVFQATLRYFTCFKILWNIQRYYKVLHEISRNC